MDIIIDSSRLFSARRQAITDDDDDDDDDDDEAVRTQIRPDKTLSLIIDPNCLTLCRNC